MTKYPMLLLSMYLLLCLPAVWMPAAAGAPPVHPRCQRRCGDVYVPYLFGIGDHCALHNVFNISSEVVNGTARPFAGPFEVTKISVADAKAWIKVNISWECYDPASRQKRRSRFREGFGYSTAPFRFSYEDDKIFVIGCNTVATIRAHASTATLGCTASCLEGEEPQNGLCFGAGCCELDVPKELEACAAYFNVIDDSPEIWKRLEA